MHQTALRRFWSAAGDAVALVNGRITHLALRQLPEEREWLARVKAAQRRRVVLTRASRSRRISVGASRVRRQLRSGADVPGAPARNKATTASTIRVTDSRFSSPTRAVIRSLLAVNSLPGRT